MHNANPDVARDCEAIPTGLIFFCSNLVLIGCVKVERNLIIISEIPF